MADTKTLDQRIRDQAVNEFAKQLDADIAKLVKHVGAWTHIKINGLAQPPYMENLMKEVRSAIIAHRQEDLGNTAVREFLLKFEEFGNQIESLGDEVNNLNNR